MTQSIDAVDHQSVHINVLCLEGRDRIEQFRVAGIDGVVPGVNRILTEIGCHSRLSEEGSARHR